MSGFWHGCNQRLFDFIFKSMSLLRCAKLGIKEENVLLQSRTVRFGQDVPGCTDLNVDFGGLQLRGTLMGK